MDNDKNYLIRKIPINELKQIINEKSNDLDKILINEKELRIENYNIIPVAILISFECKSSNGFSKCDIFLQVLKGIDQIYRIMDPYKDMNVWGIYYDEVTIDYIGLYPEFNEVEVSIS